MFCNNCGTQLPDGVLFCPECGTKVEAQAAPAPEVPVEVVAEPAPEIVPEVPEPAPVQEEIEPAPVVSEPVQEEVKASVNDAETPVVPEEPVKKEKKKKEGGGIKKALPLIIIAAVLVVVVGVGALFFKQISNTFTKTFSSPEKYYRFVEKKSIKNAISESSDLYDTVLKQAQTYDNISLQTSGGIELTPDFTSKIEKLLKVTGVKVDLEWLKSAGSSANVNIKDNAFSIGADFSLNGKSVISAEVLADLTEDIIMARIPELSQEYIYAEKLLEDYVLDEIPDEIRKAYESGEGKKSADSLFKALPDKVKTIKLANKYIDVALDQFSNVKKAKSKTVSAYGVKQTLNVIEVTIDEKTIENLILSLCNEVEHDKDIKNYFSDTFNAIKEIADSQNLPFDYEFDEIYDQLLDSIDDLKDNASDIAENFSDTYEVNYKVFVNSKGEIVGRNIEVVDKTGYDSYYYSYDSKTYIVNYVLTRDGSKYGFESDASEVTKYGKNKDTEELFKLESKGTVAGNKYTGSVKAGIDKNNEYEFEIENLNLNNVTKGAASGKIVLPISSELLSEILGSRTAGQFLEVFGKKKDIAFEITFDVNPKKYTAAVAFFVGEDKMVTLNGDVKIAGGSKVKMPGTKKAIEVSDEDDLLDWVEGFSFDGLIKKLEKAGVPDDIIEYVEDLQDLIEDYFD